MLSPQPTIQEAFDSSVRLLERYGVTQSWAKVVTECLIFADRRGIQSHGLLRLPLYLSAIESGGINPKPKMSWVKDHASGGVLNADATLGQIAMKAAVDKAVENLAHSAITAIAVYNSSHYGAGAYWSELLAQQGYAAILTSTTGPVVTPFGGQTKILGTNPLTMSLPSEDSHTLSADIATSAGAYGRIVTAKQNQETIPEGWAVNKKGNPTTDPQEALEGALIPFGGHKGSAISVLLEGFSAVFSEANFASETVDIWEDPSSKMNTGHFLIAINPQFFVGQDWTAQRVSQLQQSIRKSHLGGSQVFSPGDIESDNYERNDKTLNLTEETVNQMNKLLAANKA